MSAPAPVINILAPSPYRPVPPARCGLNFLSLRTAFPGIFANFQPAGVALKSKVAFYAR